MAYRRFLGLGLLLVLLAGCGETPSPTPLAPTPGPTPTPAEPATRPPNPLRPTPASPTAAGVGTLTVNAPTATAAPDPGQPTARAPGAGARTPTGGALTATPNPGPATAPGAQIMTLSTPAFVCRAGETPCATPAAQGLQLHTGDEIQTGAGGAALLQSATTVFHLDPDASLQFAEVRNAITRLVLRAGRLLVQHDATGRDQITITAGRLRVDALDTRFTVLSNNLETYVGVPTGGGQVTVTYEERAPVAVMGGQQAKVECATCPPQLFPGPLPVEPLDPQEQLYWDQLAPQLQLSPTP